VDDPSRSALAAFAHSFSALAERLWAGTALDGRGFAHTALIEFLRALPAGIELFHFGDSDPAGFDILRDLRERSGLKIASLHMLYRCARAPSPLGDDDPKIIKRLLSSAFLTKEEKITPFTLSNDSLTKDCSSRRALEQKSFVSVGIGRKFYSYAECIFSGSAGAGVAGV
jgi:hypothetical protein